jgi:hypothetical protein
VRESIGKVTGVECSTTLKVRDEMVLGVSRRYVWHHFLAHGLVDATFSIFVERPRGLFFL